MPSASISIDWTLISAMGMASAKTKRDALNLESGLLRSQEAMHGSNGKKWGAENLPRWQVDLNMYNHTGISEFPTGYEPFDPTSITPNRSAFYSPKISGLLMKIGSAELYTLGASSEAIQNVVESRNISCMGFLHRQFTRQIVAGGGSGFTSWGTLNGIDYTGASGGVFERTAVGSQSNTIGGLSKSTFSFAIGWNNVVVDLSNAFATNVWRLNQAIVQARRHKSGGKHVWLMSDTGLANLSRAAQGQVMYVNGADLDMGRTVPTFGGIKIYQEPQMPVSTATGGSSTNTYPITAYLLDAENIFVAFRDGVTFQGNKLPQGYFGVGQWKEITGGAMVYGCPMMCVGNLITCDMGSSAVAIRGETY